MQLPGIDAHKILSPIQRTLFTKYNIPKNAKQAAVLVLIYPNKNNEASLVLTKRAQYKGTHSKQISFPGGKKNKEDTNLKATAIRESFEEIGITPADLSTHQKLSNIYIPPSNFKVEPYLATLPYTPVFTKNYEVAEIINITIDDLLNENNLTTFKTTLSNKNTAQVPCFMFHNFYVWGATAMILSELKEVLKNL